MVIPRPRGLIAAELKSTVSRRALHTVTVFRDGSGLNVVTAREDILPYVSNPAVGTYRFALTNFLTEETAPAGLTVARAAGTPAFVAAIDSFNTASDYRDVLVTDMAGAPVDLAVNQAFSLALLVRDS